MKTLPFASKNLTVSVANLAWPILIGQLAGIANPVMDTMMVSRFSATDLAALAVGASIYISIYVTLSGVMQSLTPTFGQLYGARRFQEIGQTIRQGAIWLALLLSLLGLSLLAFPAPLLSLAEAPVELSEKVTLYLRVLAISLPASLLFQIYVTLNFAIARPKMVMAIQLFGLLLKIPLNLLFVFGFMGIPAFGGPGCAIATCIIVWAMLLCGALILKTNPFYQIFDLFKEKIKWPHWPTLKDLLKLGLPLGINFFIEVTSFTFMALFIARLGIHKVAGHQIIANFSAVLYMIPLALASATSSLVAQSIGAQDIPLAKKVAFAGQCLACGIALIVSILVWTFKESIVSVYTPDPTIAANALPLLTFVCCYQVFDTIQLTSAHILRAYKVVLAPTLLYVLTLWCTGLGGGYFLAFHSQGYNIPQAITSSASFWFSNGISLVLLSIFLFSLFKWIEKKAEKNPPKL